MQTSDSDQKAEDSPDLLMTQNMMKSILSEIKSIPEQLISLPNRAYMPNNFNLEMVNVLEKHAMNMVIDPEYVDSLKLKIEEENEEQTPKDANNIKLSATFNINPHDDGKSWEVGIWYFLASSLF